MTTDLHTSGTNLEKLNENLQKIEALSQRLVSALAGRKQQHLGLEGPGQELFVKAGAAYMGQMLSDPARLWESQVGYWSRSLTHFIEAQKSLAEGSVTPPSDPGPKDRRFSNPLWDSHPYFNFIKKQYLLSSSAIAETLDAVEGLDENDQKRVKYFAQQVVDMLAPTNFLGTNPDALEFALETDGQSLVDGLENLVRDIEANDGNLLVQLADKDAFEIGENIATTEGTVVFRNRMFELIQYAPRTEAVRKIPLVIFPPWINKFYILDLKPENSLIRWIVDQGYTLFVVSWINPDETYRDVALDDYVNDGYFAAFDEIKRLTGEDKLNAVGYCIAGTTLSLALALMAKRGDNTVNAATFFTTLTDFEDQGELGVFLTDDFVDAIEAQMEEDGLMRSFIMSRTFSYLRSNDLIYGPAIRSYMMGKAPPAFDLLFWNGDGTNLPAAMARQYLRDICQENRIPKGDMTLCGEKLNLKDIKLPIFSVACETDHIAAWKSSYDGFRKFGSRSKTFVLSESGHIAGIVNPPAKNKYGHFTNTRRPVSADKWLEDATRHAGSWWTYWDQWLSKKSGTHVPARIPGKTGDDLGPAPGTYVKNSVTH